MMKRDVRKWLTQNHRFLVKPLLILIALSVILSVTAVFFAYASKVLIDGAQESDQLKLLYGGIAIISVLGVQILTKALYSYATAYYKANTEKNIQKRLYSKVLRKKYAMITPFHSGELMNFLQSDVHKITEGVIDIVPRFTFLVLRFTMAFVLLSFLDITFALIMIFFGTLLFLIGLFVRKEIKLRHHAMQDKEAKLRSNLHEGLEHIMLIKAFEAERYAENQLEVHQLGFLKAFLAKQRIGVIASTAMQGFFSLGYAFALIYGAYRIGIGLLTYGSLIAIIQLVEFMQSPFSNLSTLLPKYYAMIGSSERIMALENIEEESQEKNTPLLDFDAIVIDDLYFSYGEEQVIKGMNTKINKNQFIVIKGPSGAGKTTLFKLFLGLYEPTKGSIQLVHNDKCVEVSSKTRNLFSYVPQGLMVISGTIKDNIVFNQEHVSYELLVEAAKTACIYEDIVKLPKGFDTWLGEKGIGLSEGQLQRIAIARALLKPTPILLFDEITSALDAETEKKILMNIKKVDNKTCFIITHREIDSSLVDVTLNFN